MQNECNNFMSSKGKTSSKDKDFTSVFLGQEVSLPVGNSILRIVTLADIWLLSHQSIQTKLIFYFAVL